ncbi:MAG: hypothetical protein NZ455_08045 [Bacteroidia bacterium]|nr:hypothetical protein [Bacteroidia bacterium]MDW8345949.1 hypothetical protein [Bacteroidia bacterium]
MGVSLRCASGRATAHYAHASVLRYRCALPNGMLRIPHAAAFYRFILFLRLRLLYLI